MAAQVETKSAAWMQIKEWLMLAGLVIVVIGGLAGTVKLVIAPLERDVRAIHGRLDRMHDEFKSVDDEFKAVREDIAAIHAALADVRERLTRLETLLERDAPPPNDAETLP